MDINEQLKWEQEKAQAQADRIAEFAESLTRADDAALISELDRYGNSELSSKIQFYIREAGNITHRTYHILEDQEDAGEEQATRRANYLAWESGRVGRELHGLRARAREYLSSALGREAHRQSAITALAKSLEGVDIDSLIERQHTIAPSRVQVTAVIEHVEELTPELIQHLKEHHSDLERMPWDVFEHLVAEFLACKGYEDVRLVGRDRATSADIFASTVTPIGMNIRVFVEVKRVKESIGIEVINQVLGAYISERDRFGWHAGLIVTIGAFRNPRKFTKQELMMKGLELRDRDDLLRWLSDYSPNSKGLYLPDPLRKMPGPTVS